MYHARRSQPGPSLRFVVTWVCTALLSVACVPGGEDGAGATAGVPTASFEQDRQIGTPGTDVQFTSTSTGNVTSYFWEFGDGGTSTAPSPKHAYASTGTYSVSLTVSGLDGSSEVEKPNLIVINDRPKAAFECQWFIGGVFVGSFIECTDTSENATGWEWEFGDEVTSTEQNPPRQEITTGGTFTVRLKVTGPTGEVCQAGTSCEASEGFEIIGFGITPDVNPIYLGAEVTFSAFIDTAIHPFTKYNWSVDQGNLEGGSLIAGENVIFTTHRFTELGPHMVALTLTNLGASPPLIAREILRIEVDEIAPVAGFSVAVEGGFGPFTAQFIDESLGEIVEWEWSFGDGSSCVFPAREPPPAGTPPTTCGSSAPSHTYLAVGAYTVNLTVSGPNPGNGGTATVSANCVEFLDAGSSGESCTRERYVRVFMVDPSFELQTEDEPIAGGWTQLTTAQPPLPIHVALSNPGTAELDEGMPSEGQKWAALDGIGTDGSPDPELIDLDHGIRQSFLYPPDRPVLEFDYVLLYSEHPAAGSEDGFVATVSAGGESVVIPGSSVDATSPYGGTSTRFNGSDGADLRYTPRRTASINLAETEEFASLPDLTLFTLTFRVGNAGNTFRSPLAFVDHVRFIAPAPESGTFPVAFTVTPDPVFVGDDASFTDTTCLRPASGCVVPTSWRWDFDTQDAATTPDRSGAGEQNPKYAFDVAGEYDIWLDVRAADLEGSASLEMPGLTVLSKPTVRFSIQDPKESYSPGDTIQFILDEASADPRDAIESLSWDFVFDSFIDTPPLQNPDPVFFPSTGDFEIRLTIKTVEGGEFTYTMNVLVQ